MGAFVIVKKRTDDLWIIRLQQLLVDQNSDDPTLSNHILLSEIDCRPVVTKECTKPPFVQWCCCSSTQGNVFGSGGFGQNSENRRGTGQDCRVRVGG